uniref:Uncharacterized protein n=1 Tax=Hucho hucho TaxID=62062 RepID=A0A4W5M1H5_9TELE
MGLQTLTPADCSPSLEPSIDMLRVQCMMEVMGRRWAPPSHRGPRASWTWCSFSRSGALSALAKGTNGPSAATADIQPQPSVNTSLQPDEMSGSVSPDPCPQSRVASNNHTGLADMMSPFFNGQPGGRRPRHAPYAAECVWVGDAAPHRGCRKNFQRPTVSRLVVALW